MLRKVVLVVHTEKEQTAPGIHGEVATQCCFQLDLECCPEPHMLRSRAFET